MKESEEKVKNVKDQKSKIRERYKGVDADSLDVIPALPQEDFYNPETVKRVAVYARVSTDDPRQTSSYELQRNHYNDMVSRRPDWQLVQIYADEGISGTSLQHRDAFVQMIRDCQEGKIDLIVTKSVSRFARNILDCIGYVRQLKAMKPPIGIFFETENIFTLNANSEMSLSFIATLAQEESHTKSEIMNSSIEMRFKRGIFLTPTLLGYDHDEDGNLIVNEDEAKTVRLIFFMYLYGYSSNQIAKTLTKLRRQTKKGNTTWSPGSVLQILQNERHCGDVLARKSFTPNYLDHKSKKNRQDRNQYRMKNHHDPIVSRDDFIAVQRMISNARYGNRGFLPEMHVVPEGILKGYVLINPRWAGFKADDYYEAALSVSDDEVQKIPSVLPMTIKAKSGDFDLRGYEIARGQFFDVKDRITVTFTDDQVSFNKTAIRKLDCEFVELLVHPEKKMLAVRCCCKEEKNAVQWAKPSDGEYRLRLIKGTAFMPTVYEILSWNRQCKYRVIGNFVEKDGESAIFFDLKETKIIVPERMLRSGDEGKEAGLSPLQEDRNKNVTAYPASWGGGFGRDYYTHKKRKERMEEIFESNGPISVRGQPYKEPELQVSGREQIEKTIAELITEMKEDQNE